MRLNTAVVISAITVVVALVMGRPQWWWIPLTILVAAVIDLRTRPWVFSPRLGSARNLSMFLKSICAVIGLYAMIGQLICLGLIVWWIFT